MTFSYTPWGSSESASVGAPVRRSQPGAKYYGKDQGAGSTLIGTGATGNLFRYNDAPAPARSKYSGSRMPTIRGEIMSVGPYKTDAYYRNQQVGSEGGTDNELNRFDLGLDEEGSRVPLEPLELPDAPQYAAPEIDEGRIDELSRSRFAPILSRLRTALGRATTANRNIDNVNARKVANRGTLSGYGEGLSSAASSSRETGRRDYLSQEYGPAVDEARTNFSAQMNKYQTNIADMLGRRRTALTRYQTS